MTEGTEHRPPDGLIALLALFLAGMAVSALLFWVAALIVTDGVRVVMAAMGPSAMAVFGTLHIPAAIVGILLLQWRRPALNRVQRVILEATTLYFGLMVLMGIFLNYLIASLLQEML